MRRVEQPIDQLAVGIPAVIGQEGIHVRDGGGQSDQVEAEPADQRDLAGLGGRGEPLGLEPGQDEAVDRVAAPPTILHRGERRAVGRQERPVSLVLGSLLDPGS